MAYHATDPLALILAPWCDPVHAGWWQAELDRCTSALFRVRAALATPPPFRCRDGCDSSVYLACSAGQHRIGCCARPREARWELAQRLGRPVRMLHVRPSVVARRLAEALCRRYEGCCVKGGQWQWFRLADADVAAFAEVADEVETAELSAELATLERWVEVASRHVAPVPREFAADVDLRLSPAPMVAEVSAATLKQRKRESGPGKAGQRLLHTRR